MARAVTKLEKNNYGRTIVPAFGHITMTSSTPSGRPRITPSASGIPAQAHVKWSDGEETWELMAALS